MNEQDRAELERLKQRQSELLAQFVELGRKLSALEARLAAAEPQPVPKPTPAPAVPPPLPPIIRPVVERPTPAAEVRPTPEPKPAQPAPAPAPQPQPPRPEPEKISERPARPIPIRIPGFAQAQAASTEPKASAQPPKKEGSFEMRLGTYWFVRIGIVMLLTGLVFFANYAYQNYITHFGPGGKVALLYLVSGGLLAAGAWLQRGKDPKLKNYAEVLFAGGLAAVYFTTYAAHHVKNLLVIKGAVTDGALLLGWAGFIIWIANRKKSEVLALFAVLLAYYTSIITHVGLFTLYSNLLLTVVAVFFLVRNRWATVSFVSLVATYVSYGFWRFYQDGHWQFVDPAEGLWTGNYFLMSYWAVFTAAVFLSRSEEFAGQRRSGFLSLNNVAFFTAFIFTMWQVHQGGFWKFSLVYGTALVALWLAARKFLAADKFCQNAYLTQGLLLITLGFITKLAGMKLSLVLATESVMLTLTGQQMKSRVMRYASMLAGVLSVAWAMASLDSNNNDDLIKGISIGASMLFQAFWLDRDKTWQENRVNLRNIFYTVLALGMWFFTTWQFTGPEWRGAWFAAEAIVFVIACRPLRNQTLRDGACVAAAAAAGWEIYYLGDQYFAIELAKRVGLIPGILVGAAMIVCALWEKSVKQPEPPKSSFRPVVTVFSSLGLITWLITTVAFVPREYLAPALALEALLLTASWYALRLKELPLFGQSFLILAQVLWLIDSITKSAHLPKWNPPWWNPVTVIAITLALAQWTQRQKSLVIEKSLRFFMQGIYALAAVGLLYYWLEPQFAPPAWLAFASALAVLLTIYAALNRYWLLAAAGQIFLLVSGYEFALQLWDTKPEWYLPLAPIATFCVLSWCAIKWFEGRPEANASVRDSVLQIGQVYRIIALVMSVWWLHKYVPARELCWTFIAVGAALFALAGWRRNRELLLFSAAFTVIGVARFWAPMEDAPRVYLPNLFAMLLLLAQQRFARRLPQRYVVPSQAHAGAILLAGLSLWFLLSRWIIEKPNEFYLTLTASWALLALALFITGIALRERMYRWLGLAILAGALGRVVFIEVWKMETIFKILSFTALGLVLLVLGFIYNKYQEKIKEWL